MSTPPPCDPGTLNDLIESNVTTLKNQYPSLQEEANKQILQLVARANVFKILNMIEDRLFFCSLALIMYKKQTSVLNPTLETFLQENVAETKKDYMNTIKRENKNAELDNFLDPYELNIDSTKFSFQSTIGLDKEKEELSKKFINTTLYPLLYTLDAVVKPKHILLYGPPGTGKTVTAKMTAGELTNLSTGINFKFFSVTASELRDKYEGGTEKNIKATFVDASKKAGSDGRSIVFFDEFEALAEDRITGDSGRSVTTLLQNMDGADSASNVTVLAATNFPWTLDGAILRRFSGKILVDLPNFDTIVEIFFTNIVKLIENHKIEHFETLDEEVKPLFDTYKKAVATDLQGFKKLYSYGTHDVSMADEFSPMNQHFHINYNETDKKLIKIGKKRENKDKFEPRFIENFIILFYNVIRNTPDSVISTVFRGITGNIDEHIKKYYDMLNNLKTNSNILNTSPLKNPMYIVGQLIKHRVLEKQNITYKGLHEHLLNFSMFIAEHMCPDPLWLFYPQEQHTFQRKVKSPISGFFKFNINGYSNSDIDKVFNEFLEIRSQYILSNIGNNDPAGLRGTSIDAFKAAVNTFNSNGGSSSTTPRRTNRNPIKELRAQHILSAFVKYNSVVSMDSNYIDMLCYQKWLELKDCKDSFDDWKNAWLSPQSLSRAPSNVSQESSSQMSTGSNQASY